MSDNTEQSGISIVFADHDQNYYVIPVEILEGGRVPAEHKAEVERLMSEHEVTGYNPALVVAAGVATGAVVGAGIAVGALAVGFVAGYAVASANCVDPKHFAGTIYT
jgi:hypothetical protein